MHSMELNTHAFQDLGGVQCLGHDYRGTDRHEETKECTETGQALLAGCLSDEEII